MKLAIVPAVALAACGAALAASPASAAPAQAAKQPAVMDLQRAGYDNGHDGWKGEEDPSCEINQWFPGFNILSGNVLNDVIDLPVNVVVAVLNVLSPTSNTSDQPIINGDC